MDGIFKVVVTGGRDFTDNEGFLWNMLFDIYREYSNMEIAQGGASGADEISRMFSEKVLKKPSKTYYANWKDFGRSAGPIRNKEMLNDFQPDLVLECPGGKGTRNCVETAKKLGFKVRKI